ncbi:hypothetical protein N783_05165 [Pontibacillus marinus BH030004 = DSM 16465]|uniref:Uncharacterized protein n=1 Tax=Pontibacillus marinus BH030004 = DSM 16465 TaxID=1385511 RepID=A0A0A5FX00_9BACI|nr:hypothetical protein N783_05165 [Pontibacillus marinus BH030004 = DSM 16465]
MKYILLFVVAVILMIAGAIGVRNTFFVAPIEYFYLYIGLIGSGLSIILGLLIHGFIRKYKSTGLHWSWQIGLCILIFVTIAYFASRTLFKF